MIRERPLPVDIEQRLGTLSHALERGSGVVFAYLFGGAATGQLRPLSDVDDTAPIAVIGRILQTRRVILNRDPFRRHRFESLALREFFDFHIFERRLLARRYGRG